MKINKWNLIKFKNFCTASVLHIQLCPTLCNPMDCPRNSPAKNSGMGYHSLLQGIFPIQGSNPGLLYCRQIPYCLSHLPLTKGVLSIPHVCRRHTGHLQHPCSACPAFLQLAPHEERVHQRPTAGVPARLKGDFLDCWRPQLPLLSLEQAPPQSPGSRGEKETAASSLPMLPSPSCRAEKS